MAEYIPKDKAVEACFYGWNNNAHDCAENIRSIPAADVRPVVKAKWVYTDKSRLVCSNCGNPVAFALKEDGWYHGDFCPNCGAMMEES